MYERTNYLAVGIFIVIGAVTLIAIGLWVGGVGKTVPMSRYTIIFERDVNGLSEGSPVRYMGVDIGVVTAIRLVRAEGTAIDVQVEIDASTPVDSGTYASLAYQGITGVAFINLAAEPGQQGENLTTDGHDYPVIPTRDVGIAALLNSGPEVLAQANNILADISILLSDENVGAATQAIRNVEQFTGALAAQRRALAALPVRMNESLDQLQDTLELLGTITEDAGPELVVAMQNLRQTSDKLVNVSAKVDHWLATNDAAIDSFLAHGIGETAALVSDAREAIRELEKLGTELRENPSRMIYKPQLEPVAVAQ